MARKPDTNMEKWIFEAFIKLAGSMPYKDITITALAKKAGISRQAFYRKYKSKDDAAKKLMEMAQNISISSADLESGADTKVVITMDYKFHVENNGFIKNILGNLLIRDWVLRDLEKRVLRLSKGYLEKLTPKERLLCRFKIYNQVGGAFNTLYKWYQEDMPISPEDLVHTFNTAVHLREETETAPNLELRLKHKNASEVI